MSIMRQAFDGIIYDTNTATLIARNELPDTLHYLKDHRNRYLYQMPDGAFFLYSLLSPILTQLVIQILRLPR